MGEIRDYWRKVQKEHRDNEKKLKKRYEGAEALPNESYSEFIRRLKKEKQSAPF